MKSRHSVEPSLTDSGAQIMDHQIELEDILLHEELEPMALSYQLLKKITDDFSDKLEIGRGGFAVVYKAVLDNGVVAVKRLSSTYMHEDKFKREVECLMNAKHKNIVRFLGYCSDTQGNMGSYNGKWVMAEVQERLLCFEYLHKGSLHGYITDSFGEIDWKKRYHIIKGICEGLNFLHQKNIMHLDLKPENILLDEDMTAKITDFGLSRCFDKDQTRVITNRVAGTMGYIAPECYRSEKVTITHKLDLYSLGIIIMEMLTGNKGYQITIENVLEIWRKTMVDELQLEQIRLCATIGIECIDFDPAKRPASMSHIIDRLAEIECSTHVISVGGTSELLLLQQVMLCFPFEPNKVITCPLELTNITDNRVAFRLTDKSMESFINLPLHGIVPPNTTYTLVLTTKEKKDRPRKYIADLVLESVISSLSDEWYFCNRGGLPNKSFHEMGNATQKVKLKALYTQPQHNTTSLSKEIFPTIKIIFSTEKSREFLRHSLDTNHAKKWITMGYQDGIVVFWDYETQSKADWLKVSADDETMCVKFIARKQWIVAGTHGGTIHVYNYEEMKKITSFTAGTYESLWSLAVHPTQPYLLSAGRYIKLWNWDHDWECIQTFEYECYDTIVGFGPNGTFASTSMIPPTVECTEYMLDVIEGDYTVKVWSVNSPKYDYALDGHSNRVACLDFLTYHGHEFLVTGSDDKTAKIWYLETKKCAYTLEAFVSPVTSVLYQPDLQTLFTGSNDGSIYLWSTANCRIYSCPPTLTKVINIGGFGKVYHLTYVMGRKSRGL